MQGTVLVRRCGRFGRRWIAMATLPAGLALLVVGTLMAGKPAPNPCDGHPSPTPRKCVETLFDGGRAEYWCASGKLHGIYTIWNKAGRKVSEGTYDKGSPDGLWRDWHANGKLSEETLYEQGVTRRNCGWDESGKWRFFGQYDRKGDLEYWVSFDAAGKKTFETGLPPAKLPTGLAACIGTQDSIPHSIIERADACIAGKVGKEYFAKNYRFVRKKSEFYVANGGNCYLLRYDYAALTRIGCGEPICLWMNDKPDRVPDAVVAVVKDGRVVEPKISNAQAMKLAAKRSKVRFFRQHCYVDLLMPSSTDTFTNWTWEVSIPMPPPASDTMARWFFRVDAITGVVEDMGVSTWAL